MSKGLSERQSCRLAGISRTGYHYLPQANDDEEVIAELVAYARRRPRFGYRRAYRFVRKERPTINHKRVQRLWQRAKLQVLPRRRRKRRRDPQRQVPRQALHPRHVITYDFMEDSTIDGRTLRILTMVDEFTRECLALYVARSIPSAKVISVLARVVERYGVPEFIRSDNGPEFIAQAVCSWILFQDAQTHHIDPASPWQNAYGESFNARLRDECLNLEEFTSVVEAQVILDAWRKDYNTQREHSGIGYLSPTEFYAAWLARQP